MAVNYLDRELMEKMCHRLAVAVFDKKEEPISPFNDHTKSLLDSALNAPKATFGGKELYPTLVDKATILYYHLNKNHPFGNGNKRIAAASLLVFLFINKHWLLVDEVLLAEKTLQVAKSNANEREKILSDIKEWIGKYMIKLGDLREIIKNANR